MKYSWFIIIFMSLTCISKADKGLLRKAKNNTVINGASPCRLPFQSFTYDINEDGIADLRATYAIIGNELVHNTKCFLRPIKSKGQQLFFYYHMKTKSFLNPGDTLYNKKPLYPGLWTPYSINPARSKSSISDWVLSRPDLQNNYIFYCGLKFIFEGRNMIGWVKFQLLPDTGKLVLIDKKLSPDNFIVIGK